MTPLERIQQALHSRGTDLRQSGQGWVGCCPAHDDHSPSLSIREEKPGGRILVKCFGGCPDTAVLASLGLTVKDLFPEEAQASQPPRSRFGLRLTELAAAKQLPVKFLKQLGVKTTWMRKPLNGPDKTVIQALTDPATWESMEFRSQWREVLIPYLRADGTTARARRRMKISGNQKHCWAGTADDGDIIPYGLDRLQIARDRGFLILVEGETDCWSLWLHGFPALGVPGASNAKTLRCEHFTGIDRVYLVQEPDGGGETFFKAVQGKLSSWKSWTGELLVVREPGGAKDVCDLRVRDPEGFTAAMEKALGEAEPVALGRAADHASTSAAQTDADAVQCPYELGRIDPDTNRLVLSTQRTLPTAEAYMRQFHAHPDGWTLRHYAGLLLEWKGTHYREVENKAMSNRLFPWLHAAAQPQYNIRTQTWFLDDFPANPRTVHAALESISAYTHLSADTNHPCWLSDNPKRPPSDEILACKSTLLHLPTRECRTPTPAFFTLNGLDFDPDLNAGPPEQWLRFLRQILGDDSQSIELLQDWFGYCLTPDTSQQKMLLMVGPKRCGKGTIARVLGRLVGKGNVTGPTTSSLAKDFGLQPLLGKSLAVVSDARFSGTNIQTVIERLLCVSGEDTLTVDRKHLTSVTLKLSTRFMFLTNEVPRLADVSGALAGRFMMLKFTETFFGREDKGLTARLCAELPGILNWAIEGWERLRQRGHFVQPDAVESVVTEMEELGSPVGAFVRDYCELGPGKQTPVDLLFQAWNLWCSVEGRTSTTTRQRFGRDLSTAVPKIQVRKNNITGRFYQGIGLTDRVLALLRPKAGWQKNDQPFGADSSPSEQPDSAGTPPASDPKSRAEQEDARRSGSTPAPVEQSEFVSEPPASDPNPGAKCRVEPDKCRVETPKCRVECRVETGSESDLTSDPTDTCEDQCRVVPRRNQSIRVRAHTHAHTHTRGEELSCSSDLRGTTRKFESNSLSANDLSSNPYAAPGKSYAALDELGVEPPSPSGEGSEASEPDDIRPSSSEPDDPDSERWVV